MRGGRATRPPQYRSGDGRRRRARRFARDLPAKGGGAAIDHAHLRKLRIVRARELPASTDLRVGEIATAWGFAQMEHLSAMFRRECGMNPQDFRSRRRARLASHRQTGNDVTPPGVYGFLGGRAGRAWTDFGRGKTSAQFWLFPRGRLVQLQRSSLFHADYPVLLPSDFVLRPEPSGAGAGVACGV